MKRRQSRENAVVAMFEFSFAANSMEDIIEMSRMIEEFAVDDYAEKILNYFCENSCEVDDLIKDRLKDWKMDRLPKINVAILRTSVSEMMASSDNIDSIVINEAVEIAKKYSGDTDYQFINGILGAIALLLHPEA